MIRTNRELKLIFWGIVLLFAAFLAGPIVLLLGKSLWQGGLTGEFYTAVLSQDGFFTALGNSFAVAGASAAAAVLLAFLLAYAVHYTRLSKGFKRGLCAVATLPMFLPTITYGFAIIYSFGKQGLLTRLMGRQLFDIYGFWGLMVGYMIYTVPVAFLLIQNTMGFVDKKTITVSKVMGDNNLSTFWVAILRPLLGTLAGAFIQAFFLSFTDFGIPASVGGDYPVIATMLYNQMLGGIPDFNRGAVMAMVMLIPSIGSICILQLLERFNIRYNRISNADLRRNALRDGSWGISGTVISLAILSIFAVIFVVPLVEEWPYKTGFSLEHFQTVFADESLLVTYGHSVLMALLTAALGTLTAYGAALITARSTLSRGYKRTVESIALVTNAIPGMVLGVAYLFLFSGTSLQNTLLLMVLCNVVHYFSTPYLMMKNALSKMNAGWETTAMLMGDSWMKTILRIVTPNALSSLIQVFSYYFINSMVTISALIFIAGARTMVLTTMIKQLQYTNRFNEVFVLSLLILATNLAAKALFSWLAGYKSRKMENQSKGRKKRMNWKKTMALGLSAALCLGAMTACSKNGGTGKEDQVVIYSNADEEAVKAMENALDNNGYKGKYIFQTYGTSELGGKLLAEGTNLEADLVTMSTFYLQSAQEQNNMFQTLDFEVNTLTEVPDYTAPITSQEGAIILNTELMKSEDLPVPTSLKDLTKKEYAGQIAVTDIQSSSTAWLLIQALVDAYGDEEAQEVLAGIYENCGAHIETSGSGPLKLCRAGEVAIGFGLRHQAVADKNDDMPIDYVDPEEGNFSLTESVAVVDKGKDTNPLAMEMAQCIMEHGREELIKTYPNPLYEGETADPNNQSANPSVFDQPLTFELFQAHQKLSEAAKG